jgi:putative component of toxin-antitoxin plasmid stabilization module
VYYVREGRTIIILLGGGGKRRQDADIAVAVERWKRYKQTKN